MPRLGLAVLILTLQNIRNLLGQTVNIVKVNEGNQATKGVCASIRAGDLSRLKAVCSGFLQEGSISKLVEDGNNLFLEARPSPTETLSVEDALADNPYFSLLPEMEVQGIEQFLGS